MTANTTALQERIRRARSVPAEWARLREGESTREQIERHQRRMDEQTVALIAAEVRAAKAEALREMQAHHEREADKAQTITARGIHLTIADGARNRATEYETGDRA